MIELTNAAYQRLLEQKDRESFQFIRLGITGGGCAGFEYVFDSCDSESDDDIVIEWSEVKFVIDKISVPYLTGMTLDYVKEGLNEVFKFINPKEEASCGCGVSIQFDLEKVKLDEKKIFAIEL
jgi:iron-sulfur cluster assembly accessory protein